MAERCGLHHTELGGILCTRCNCANLPAFALILERCSLKQPSCGRIECIPPPTASNTQPRSTANSLHGVDTAPSASSRPCYRPAYAMVSRILPLDQPQSELSSCSWFVWPLCSARHCTQHLSQALPGCTSYQSGCRFLLDIRLEPLSRL